MFLWFSICTARLRGRVKFGSVVKGAVCRMSALTRVTVTLLGLTVFFFLEEGVNVEVSVCVLNFHACVIGRLQQWLTLLNFQCVVNLSWEDSTIQGQPSHQYRSMSQYSSGNSLLEQSTSNAIVFKFASSG